MLLLFNDKTDTEVFRAYPALYELISGLKGSFQITWAAERVSHGSHAVCLILKPSSEIRDTFGFEKEIAFFLFPYDNIQARMFQAIDQFCGESPMHERVDPSVVLVNAPDSLLQKKVRDQQSEYPQAKMIIALTDDVLKNGKKDDWAIRNAIKDSLFIRDLFNYKLPLQPNQYFYGREQVVASLVDNVRKRQNSGLFGLRKTGKTSTLMRVSSLLKGEGALEPIFIDCKKRFIRNLGCDGLIEKIVRDIDVLAKTNSSKLFKSDSELDATEVLERAVRAIPKGKTICVIFDEIEYISPISPTNSQWRLDFVDFWQAVWAIQSETQKICFIICGVNPSVCEISRFELESGATVQNPMFGIVNIQYLQGFERVALERMIAFFGKRMGMRFSSGAVDYIHERFGGHPLLSRLACSFYHERLLADGVDRPIDITRELEIAIERECESEIASYCEHVVSEVREFYPDEYELLSLISRGETEAFREFSTDPSSVNHIKKYGLVSNDEKGKPRVLIPVLEKYIRNKFMRDNGLNFHRDIIKNEYREEWLSRRKSCIEADLCLLNEIRRESGEIEIFPGGGLKRIGDFIAVPQVECQNDLVAFLIPTHTVLVENVETSFKKSGLGFHKEFAGNLALLYKALMRLKTYRHSVGHIDLEPQWRARFELQLEEDFGADCRRVLAEDPFIMQQIVLDEIHEALQYEIAAA